MAFVVVRPDGNPDLDERIRKLCRRRNPYRMATAYRESDTHLPIPAPAICLDSSAFARASVLTIPPRAMLTR